MAGETGIGIEVLKEHDEEELIKQIESDTGLDSELEQQELVKGHVVEIRYNGKAKGKPAQVKKSSSAVHA